MFVPAIRAQERATRRLLWHELRPPPSATRGRYDSVRDQPHHIAIAELRGPSVPEQRAIATVLTNMGDEIAALERRLEKTRAVKQGMMQQLVTGAVRLPIPDDGLEGESHDA